MEDGPVLPADPDINLESEYDRDGDVRDLIDEELDAFVATLPIEVEMAR